MNPTNSEPPDITTDFPTDFKFKSRTYIHFDLPISSAKAKSLVTNINLLSKHSFLPFLSRTLKSPKYKKDDLKVRYKARKIAFASHTNAAIYQYYTYKISKNYEEYLLKNNLADVPTAYRKLIPSKCNIDFAKEAFTFIASHIPAVVIACDITGFFDNLNHDLLKKEWCKILNTEKLPLDHFKIYKSITKYSFVSEEDALNAITLATPDFVPAKNYRLCTSSIFRDTIRGNRLIHSNDRSFGIPQGSPISGLMSNIYMISFDLKLKEFSDHHNGYYRRYSDDILIVLPINKNISHNILRNQAEEFIKSAINEVFLNIKEEKTEIFTCLSNDIAWSKPIQYLGLTYNGKNIHIRCQTLSRYYGRVNRYLKKANRKSIHNIHRPNIHRKTLHKKHTHLGKSNFITYAYRCAQICNDQKIRKQVSNHMKIINNRIYRFKSHENN